MKIWKTWYALLSAAIPASELSAEQSGGHRDSRYGPEDSLPRLF
jgi:hypothetical protein